MGTIGPQSRTTGRRRLAGVLSGKWEGVLVGCVAMAGSLLHPLGAQDVSVTPTTILEAPAGVTSIDFSSGGDLVAVGDEEGNLRVWDLDAGSEVLARSRGSAVRFSAFLSGDTAVAVLDEEGSIAVHSIGEPAGDDPLLETADAPVRAALDAGRRILAVATEGGSIELFDLPTRQRIGLIDARGDLDDLLYLGFDRRGRQLAAVTAGGGVTAWDPSTLERLRRVSLQGSDLYGSRSVVHAAGADRSANILVTQLEEVALPRGGLRGRARPGDLERRDHLLVFDWYSGAEIRTMPSPAGEIEVLAVGPGNDHVVVARDEDVTVVDLRRGERGAVVTAPGNVSHLAVSADAGRLAVGSEDGSVGLWALEYTAPSAEDLADAGRGGIGGRLRVLGEDEPAVPADSEVSLAVLPFDERDGDGRLAVTAAELLTTQLSNLDHLTMLERLRIDALMEEHDLAQDGVTEPGGLEVGQLLNADYVLLGSIGASGSTYTISARLLRVETGEVVAGRQVLCEECRAPELFDAIHLLGTTIAR